MRKFESMNNANYQETDGEIILSATANTDFIINPETNESNLNAPFVYQEISGDFVITSRVSHDFKATYDACVLFAYQSDTIWAKACFELSDFNTHAVVTVMTNGISDDANCINVDGNEIWLRLSRKNNTFAVHYSYDNMTFYMARICHIPMNEQIKVGIVAQSPIGEGMVACFEELTIMNKTPENIRFGQ